MMQNVSQSGESERLLNTGEVAKRLACSRRNVRILIRAGRLRAKRLGRRTLKVSQADLNAYIESLPDAGSKGDEDVRSSEV